MERNEKKVVHIHDTILDKEYLNWIAELKTRYRGAQIKASATVNKEMIRLYWSIGEDIVKRQMENRYGSHFYENLSKDLMSELHIKKGLSPSMLKYMRYFYQLYSQMNEIRQQPADELDLLFSIPWSHHMCIIDKVSGDPKRGIFFVRKTIENNWSRGVLMNFLSSDLYDRQGSAQTNFASTLPSPESDLAQELLKSPYDFSFLPEKERYQERELKKGTIYQFTREQIYK